jgi:glucokinase
MARTSDLTGTPCLIADIGGTNVRFALQPVGGAPANVHTLRGDDHETFEDLLEAMWEEADPANPPKAAVLAVACPPGAEQVRFTNRDWQFGKTALRKRFGLDRLVVINDFEALALALPHLGHDDTIVIGGGTRAEDAAMAVLGPGTGLGVAALLPAGDRAGARWHPVAGEGGHVTLPARTALEREVIDVMGRDLAHVSAERALSGPGVAALHDAVRNIEGLAARHLAPADVVEAAGDGDAPARVALDLFAGFLGTVASDTALTFGARGGLFLAGGVIPRMGTLFAAELFRARFEDKGRFSTYCAAIPTRLITHEQAALLGVARALPMLLDQATE